MSKKVVLLGGGHAHLILLNLMRKDKKPTFDLVVISDSETSSYSGLLPEFMSSNRPRAELLIPTKKIVESLGGHFILAQAEGLDPIKNQVLTSIGSVGYDCLSINTGGRKNTSVPGSEEHGQYTRPFPRFEEAFLDFQARSKQREHTQVIILGGGPAGVETAFSFKSCLEKLGKGHKVVLVESESAILPRGPIGAQRLIQNHLMARGIEVLTSSKAKEINATEVILRDGNRLKSDFTIITLPVMLPEWLAQSPLEKERGFVFVNSKMQTSAPNIFASGDIAARKDVFLPRAGVYAIRQGPILYKNISSFVAGRPLVNFKPQRQILNLLSDAEGRALATRGPFYLPFSKILWLLKRHLDRSFTRLFDEV